MGMISLDNIDWSTLTRQQAGRLVGGADKREQRLAKRVNAPDADAEDHAAWLAAFTLWEDLRIFIHCGEKPASTRGDKCA